MKPTAGKQDFLIWYGTFNHEIQAGADIPV
jgi:hypothetical protein